MYFACTKHLLSSTIQQKIEQNRKVSRERGRESEREGGGCKYVHVGTYMYYERMYIQGQVIYIVIHLSIHIYIQVKSFHISVVYALFV